MLKYTLKILAFIFIFFAVYFLLLHVWITFVPDVLQKNFKYPYMSYGHTFTRLQEAKNFGNVDILFCGSSHSYRGFDPRIFEAAGYKSFNLGTLAQTPLQTEILLKRYITELNPEMIIYEVYPFIFTSDGIESSLDIIANDVNDLYSIDMAFTQNHIKVYNALFYDYVLDVFKDKTQERENLSKYSDRYITGGYVEKKVRYYKFVEYDSNNWDFNQKQFESFKRSLDIINNKDIRFILIQAPITSRLYHSYNNNDEFNNIICNFGEYYNYNDILELNDSLHFYDEHHLNQDGVNIFNNTLLDNSFFRGYSISQNSEN